MSFISNISQGTKTSLFDATRPKAMIEADKLYQRITLGSGNNAFVAVSYMSSIANLILSTPFDAIDETFWEKAEKVLNNGNDMTTSFENPEEQYNVILGMMYSTLEVLDKSSDSFAMMEYRNMFFQTRNYIANRVISHQNDKQQRVVERILRTIEVRIDQVTKRINKEVESGKLPGPSITG